MKDRFTAGAVSGLVGAVLQVIYGYAVKALGLADRSFQDFGIVFVVTKNTNGILDDILGIISVLTNGAIVGIIFAYLISYTSSRYYLLKGFLLGIILWHLFLGIGTLFKIPVFDQISTGSSLNILIGSGIYGIVSAYILRNLNYKKELL